MEINFMDKGYILHNGVLKSYELLEISICFSTDIIRYKCLIGGKEERLCEAPMTYRSEEDFKNGNEFGHNSVTLGDVTISALGFKGIDTAFTCKDGKVNPNKYRAKVGLKNLYMYGAITNGAAVSDVIDPRRNCAGGTTLLLRRRTEV